MATCLIVLSNFLSGLAIASEVAIDKTVNDSTLMTGAAVEFVVTARNTGDLPIDNVVVTDRLPEGLGIPEGVAPFATQGTYDPESGDWLIGALAASGEATLQLPASVTADPLPPCIVNRAFLEGSQDSPFPVTGAAALRTPTVNRCMQLDLNVGSGPLDTLGCGVANVEVILFVRNLGPDDARNVLMRLEPSPKRPPGLRFINSFCERKTECTIESIDSGDLVLLKLMSDGGIKNSDPREFNVAFSAAVPDADFNAGQDAVFDTFTKRPFKQCPSIDVDGGGGGGGGGGCFVATAAYGSAMHPHVDALREWRDRVLLNSAAGRSLVELYYRYSPPLADFIAERPELRAAARALLWPLVVAVLHPMLAGACVVLFAFGLIARRRRRREIYANSAVG